MRSSSCCKRGVILAVALPVLSALGCRVADLVNSPPGSMMFSRQPSGAESGQPIVPPVEVSIFTPAGTPDSTVRKVIMQLAANPGDGTLSGETEVETVAGVARFSGLVIDEPGEGYALRAVVREGGAAASDAFEVVRPPAAQLVFTVQPTQYARPNQAISPAIEVTALEGDGDPVPWFNGAITLALAPNALGAAATGTLTVNAVGGVARFANVQVDRIGVDLRLTAAFAGGAPTRTSEAFTVIP